MKIFNQKNCNKKKSENIQQKLLTKSIYTTNILRGDSAKTRLKDSN